MTEKLNGSVERLAEALRDVVKEGAAEAVEPLRNELREVREDIQAVEERLNTRLDRAVEDIVAERQQDSVP